MQRRQFLSSVVGGVAGGLPLTARGDAPQAPHTEPAAAAPSAQALEYGAPLFTLTLADGREIRAENIVAWRTYMGLLAGLPNDEINERELSQLKEICNRALLVEDSVIIPPAMIAHESDEQNWNEYPPIFVAARFFSSRDTHGGSCGRFSALAVGWFQTSLHPLIPDDILAAIKQLNWTNLAHDFMF
jgi:hypothetical protein